MPHQHTLTADTNVPIKVVVPIISAIIVVSLWVNTTLNRIEASIHDTWRIKDMQKWTRILEDKNPNVRVPSPYEALASHRWDDRPMAYGPTTTTLSQ